MAVVGTLFRGLTPPGPMSVRRYDARLAPVWDLPLPDLAPGKFGGAGAVSAAVDAASEVFVGYQRASGGTVAFAVEKRAPAGSLLWDTELATTRAAVIAAGPDGGVYVAGSTSAAFPGTTGAGGQDAFVARLDPGGNLLWIRLLGGPGDDVADVTMGHVDPSAPQGGLATAFVARLDAAGTLLWARELPAGDQDGTVDLVVDGAGFGIALVDVHTSLSFHDTWLLRLAPDGT